MLRSDPINQPRSAQTPFHHKVHDTVGLSGLPLCPGGYDTRRQPDGSPLFSVGGTHVMAIHTPRKP